MTFQTEAEFLLLQDNGEVPATRSLRNWHRDIYLTQFLCPSIRKR